MTLERFVDKEDIPHSIQYEEYNRVNHKAYWDTLETSSYG